MRSIVTLLIVSIHLAPGCADRYTAPDPGADAATPDAAQDAAGPDGDTTDAAEGQCGNGVTDPGEACDGLDLGGLDCVGLGFFEGSVTCRTDCTLDTSGCRERCGNGAVDPGEACDGANLAGQTCQGLGLGAGVLSCRPDCGYDLTGCPGCGNGVLEAPEGCDSTDFGGASCTGGLVCTTDCHVDATGCDVPGTGTGADGVLNVDGPTVLEAPLASSYSVISLGMDRATVDATADALAPGDEVLVINLQGSDAACGTVGVHEFLTVSSTAGSEVVFGSVVQEIYGVGGDNTDLSGQAIVVQRVPNLSSMHVTSGGILTTIPWNGTRGGLLVLRVDGAVTLDPQTSLTVSGLGYNGGAGVGIGRSHGRQGESICGNPQAVDVTPNHGGGGGGIYLDTNDDCGQGGGGAGYAMPGGWRDFTPTCVNRGATTPAANGGGIYGVNSLPRWHLGSGGGSGGTDDHSTTSGTGGRGGGILVVFARSLVVDGAVSAAGGDGQVPSDFTDSGNGGGGSGGTILLHLGALSGAGAVRAPGGLGPPPQHPDWNSPGGDGAVGRIRIDYQSGYGLLPGDPLATWYLEHLCHPAPGYTSVVY